MTDAILESVIGVFARAPEPGQTKTRLIPRLGADAAARLHSRLVRHTVETALASDAGPVELWCAPSQSHPFFQKLATEHSLRLQTQGDGDLGERMADAFRVMLGDATGAILVGSRLPGPHCAGSDGSETSARARMRRGPWTSGGRRVSPDCATPTRAPAVRGRELGYQSGARTDALAALGARLALA